MRKADIAICGAGIIGLTVANELVNRGHANILVLEKEQTLGKHASGRNSGVLHAGVYYSPESERAKTCLKGNRLMKRYCAENNLPVDGYGKVIVAKNADELATLNTLHERALQNGADVALISRKQLDEIEPNAKTHDTALHSRDTAVVNPRAILASLRQTLEQSGKVTFLTGCKVTGVRDESTVDTSCGSVSFHRLVNALGAHSDTLAHLFGISNTYKLLPFKGVYRKLRPEKASMIRGSIYPVPNIENPFLGIHFTRSVDGEVYLGPTAIPALGRENYGILSGLDAEAPTILLRDATLFLTNPEFRKIALTEPRKYIFRYFYEDARKLVKNLDPTDIVPSTKAGIRPQLIDTKTGELVMDFKLTKAETSIHVLNAISPAFTSSMAFAQTICNDMQL